MENHPTKAAPRRQLTLFDSTCIIVGIIIGAGIYSSSPEIARQTPNVFWLIGVWLIGGTLSLIGALCYAELANAYPEEGGDYVYLTTAMGRKVGFLFAWCQLWIVRPGSIGAMAYAFAEYANYIWPRAEGAAAGYVMICYAAGSIVAMTAVNIIGVQEGKWTQNILTVVKVLGLAAIIGVGLFVTGTVEPVQQTTAPADFTLSGFSTAMIFVLFAFGGWNEMAYVGAELRNPRKNILRALLLGTVAVTLIYVLANLAFVNALGFEGARRPNVAANVLAFAVGGRADMIISLLICISALGAVNGQIFTGSRIYYAFGTEHKLYAWMGRWNARSGTPIYSLLIQGAITLALAVLFGLSRQGFNKMVIFTTSGFWLFLALVGAALIVLRFREPNIERPYRVPGYPVTPIIFCLSSLFMVYASLDYAVRNGSSEALWAVVILLVGVGMCFFDPRANEEVRCKDEQKEYVK